MLHIPHATSSTAHGRKHRPFFLHPLERKRSASNNQRPLRLQCASLEEEGRREKGRRNRGRRKEGGRKEGGREGEKEGDILIILMHIHVHSMNQ